MDISVRFLHKLLNTIHTLAFLKEYAIFTRTANLTNVFYDDGNMNTKRIMYN